MAKPEYKLEPAERDPQGTPAPGIAPQPQTVEITVTRPDTETETVNVDLPLGDELSDKRLIVAFVGVSQTGSFNPEQVVLDVPAADVAALSFAVGED
jgi:hypothetical protein